MNLVQRKAQLSFLADSFAEGARGRGQVALVSGPVASGRTELIGTLADHALEQGALVLEAIAVRSERDVQLGVISQLMHSPVVPAELVDAFGRLLEEEPAPSGEDVVRPQTTLAVASALTRLAQTAPVLITVDDVQHADEASLHCLLFLIHRIRAARITIVFTERTTDRPVGPVFHAELVRLPHCRRIRLEPLDVDGVAELLAQADGGFEPDAAAALAPAYHELTAGNLVLLNALLEDHSLGDVGPGPAPGFAFCNAVLSCLHSLGPIALNVARGVAVLGAAASPGRIGELVEAGADDVVHTLRELEGAGLLHGGRFRTPVAVDAVLEGAEPACRVSLQRRAAHLLHDAGVDAAVVAELLVAADCATEPWAVPVLRSAAERALAVDDVAKAIRYLEPASRVGDLAQRMAITTLLADAEARVSPAAAERRVRSLSLSLNPANRTAGYVPRYVRHLLWHGKHEEATGALAQVGAGDDLDQALSAELDAMRLSLACTHPPLAGRLPARRRPAGPRPAAGGTAVDTQWRAARVLRAVLQGRSGDNVVVGAEQVLQSTRLSDATVEPLCFALRALVYVGRSDRALPWCERLLEESVARKAPAWQALFEAIRAEVAVRQGDLMGAREHGEAALSLISSSSWGVGIGAPVGSLLRAYTAMGEYQLGDALLESQPVPEAMMQTVFALPFLHARGLHHLATNRVYAALRDFMACGELMTTWNIDLPALVPWRTDCAQAYLRIGDSAKAAELVDGQLDLVGEGRSPARGETLRVLANTHAPADRPHMLMQAIDEIQSCGDRLELAKALADLGRAHHALNDTSRARMTVRRAWHVAKECHAESVCHELLPHLAGDDAAAAPEPVAESDVAARLASLTSAEYRTAALARHGYTNREIARKLFITVSTVEQHLTRTYKKLQVGTRADLPAGLEPHLVGWADSTASAGA